MGRKRRNDMLWAYTTAKLYLLQQSNPPQTLEQTLFHYHYILYDLHFSLWHRTLPKDTFVYRLTIRYAHTWLTSWATIKNTDVLLTTIYVLAPYSDTTRIHHSELRHMPTEALLELSNFRWFVEARPPWGTGHWACSTANGIEGFNEVT